METIRDIWRQILRDPKGAIREAMDRHEKKFTVWLVILFGITLFIEQAVNRNLGDDFSTLTIFIFAIVLGPLFGLISWLFLSGVGYVTARMLGGTGTWEETRIAAAWSTLPYISKWIVLFFQLIMFRGEMFKTETPVMSSSLFLLIAYLVLLLVDLAMTVWYYYVFSQAMAEVHAFSAWKGFLSIILIPVLLVLLLVVLALVV